MTYHEVIQSTTREEMAELLTALACGAMGGGVDPKERAKIYGTVLDFLGQEVNQ